MKTLLKILFCPILAIGIGCTIILAIISPFKPRKRKTLYKYPQSEMS
jgi:hypothetical protein